MKGLSMTATSRLACLSAICLLLSLTPAAVLAHPGGNYPTAVSKIYIPILVKSGPGLVPQVPQCVDCPKAISLGTQHSLRLDGLGQPHISYGGDHLYHAWNDGAAWRYETVDSSPGVGYYSTLAFDNTGKPAIAYLDLFNSTLKLARWSGAAWTTQAVDNTTTDSTNPTLLFDSSNNPLVAYVAGAYSTSYQVKFARWTGSAWNISTVDTGIDAYRKASVSLALDKNGAPHLSYFRNDTTREGGLIYATWTGSTWSLQIVDPTYDNGNANSLAFDSQGVPHISYYADFDEIVMYASWNSQTSKWDLENAWTGVTVERTSATSLTFGSGDMPMIAVSLGDTSSLPCLVWLVYKPSPSGFVHSLVSDMDSCGVWPSIASDSSGKPRISYVDYTHNQLHYASLTAWNTGLAPDTWTNEVLDAGAQVGQGVSVAMDRFGRPHVAYMDLTNGLMKYAYQETGLWKTTTVDIPGMVPAHGHSLAVNSSGKPHIAYSDYGAKKVMYASWNGSAWTAEVVGDDLPGVVDDIEKFISLALDASGSPHISFYNQHDLDLKHYYKVGSAWQSEEVDKNATGVTGVYNAIAIDSAGKIHISYQNNYAQKLMYAYWNGISWTKTVADDTYTSGMNTSIAVDAANRPHICHSDIADYFLRYAYYNGSAWVHETLTPSSTGLPDSRQPICSIKIGANNTPYISYFDRISRHLTLTHKVGAAWVTETLDPNGDTGQHNSMAMFNGIPFIGYYHGSNKDLMFLEWKP